MLKILKFFNEVKQELLKVTWLSIKETMVSTMIVLVVVVVFSSLFVLVDFMIFHFVQFILNLRF